MHAAKGCVVILVMANVRLAAAVCLLAGVVAMAQQPRFDVASVKVAPRPVGGDDVVTPTSLWMKTRPLGFLIRWAYGLHPYQAFETSGPDWLEPGLGVVWFDIQAKTDHPVTVDQLRLMMRTLLAERLKLAVHRENREMTVGVLAVAKDGPKLHPSDQEELSIHSDGDVIHFKGETMSRMDEWLYQWIPYLVVDETGLPGRYDFDLNVMQYGDYFVPGPGRRTDGTMAVNKALQPLGLKLEQKRRSVEVLVIDHAEKTPTEN